MTSTARPAAALRPDQPPAPGGGPQPGSPQSGGRQSGGPRARRQGLAPLADRLRRFLHSPLAPYHLLLASTAMLVLVGTVMVLSAGIPDALFRYGFSQYTGVRQVVYVGLAAVAFFAASRVPVSFYRRMAVPLLIVSLVLLVAVLVPAIGKYQSGARRWIMFGPLSFQPSEVAKVALALWGADLLDRKRRLLASPKHLFIPLVPVSGLLLGLIMLEPDLGTTMSTALIVFGMLWIVGVPMRVFAMMTGAAAVVVLALGVAAPYRLARLTGFVDPWSQADGNGYQAVQSMLGIAGGGVAGVGLGNGEAKWQWLPNAHTDFVFAVVAEELGLLGVALVLGLFLVLIYALVRIARDAGGLFVRLFVGGIAVWFAGQALINLGAVTGLLPITGVPLPLISFGGTALVAKVGVLGMVAAMARQEPVVAQALARRRARRQQGGGPRARLPWRRGRVD